MVTIFTPTYNRAYIIGKLYGSLLEQTDRNFEWLIVDDGSTDNTRELVGSFIREDRISIRYFRQENSGEFVPQNVGLRMIDAPECAKEPGDFSPGNRLEMLKNYERMRPIFWENFRRKRPKSF